MPVSTTKMFKELEAFLEKYGITVKNWEMGKRHRKVWVTDGAKTALSVV